MSPEFGLDDDECPPWPDTERLLMLDELALALSEVWSGADVTDAKAVADALEDRGLRLERA